MRALLRKIKKLLKDKRFRRIWYRGVSSVAAVVVFVTTYALVLPAITLESKASCGMMAHQHTDACYSEVLVCGKEEGEGHHHDAGCYEKVLTCGMEAHIHSEECYKQDSAAVTASIG